MTESTTELMPQGRVKNQVLLVFAFSTLFIACSEGREPEITQAPSAPESSSVVGSNEEDGSAEGRNETTDLLIEAQSLYDTHREHDPVDECDIDGNWKYQILRNLSLAVELNPQHTINYLDSAEFGFKAEEAYIKWRVAATRTWSQDSLKGLLIDSEWWPMSSSFPPYWVEFTEDGQILVQTMEEENDVGSWRLDQARLLLSLEAKDDVQLEPVTVKSYFNEGNSWFFALMLQSQLADVSLPWNMPLILGPPAGDCGEYNF